MTGGGPGEGPGALAVVAGDASPLMTAVALTPAARGYPGGIADATEEWGRPPPRDGGAVGLARAQVWQRSFAVWQQAGLDWEPAAPAPAGCGREPAEATVAGHGLEPAGPGPEGAAPGRGAGGRKRRLHLVAAATCLVVLAGGLAGIVATSGAHGGSRAAAFGLTAPVAPARLADGDFPGPPAGAAGAGLVQPELAALAAAGGTVVAAGSRPGLPGARAVFLVSADGGRTWRQAALPGAAAAGTPTVVAGGDGGWLALGGRAGWSSPDGRTWHAVPGPPGTASGDRVTALARTGTGFVAVGEGVSPPGAPVLWASPGGRAWRQAGPAALGLTRRAAGSVRLRWVAARGAAAVIGGEVNTVRTVRRGRRNVTVPFQSPALWRSGDGGLTWRPVTLPGGRFGGLRAGGGLRGLTATGSGFVAVRSGTTAAGRPDAVVYTSVAGLAWHPVAVLTAGPLVTLRDVTLAGGDDGAVVTGLAQWRRYAFVSAAGRRWHRVAGLAAASGGTLTALAAGPGGTVLAAGLRSRPGTAPAAARPFLLAGSPLGPARQVGRAVLAAAAATDVTVGALASHGPRQVAAGSAGGAPAVWWAVPGHAWARSRLSLPPAWDGGAGLASAAWGPAGWIALGSTTGFGAPAGAAPRPVALTSTDGISWRPAPHAGSLLAPGVTLAQAAAGPAGYVVVGSEQAGGGRAAAAWYSADLSGWARASEAGATAGAGSGARQMLAVTAVGGGFVAAGHAGNSPAVWASASGTAWRPAVLPLPAGATAARLTSVTADGRRVVATGTAVTPGGTQAFSAWSGNGGRTWRESPLPRPAGVTARRVGVTALTTVPGGFVAAGAAATATGQDVLVWWSRTGLSWHAAAPAAGMLAGPGWHTITALAASGHTLTAAGYVATGTGQHPILWQPRFR